MLRDTLKVLAAAGLLPLAWKRRRVRATAVLMRVHIGSDHAGLETKQVLVGGTD